MIYIGSDHGGFRLKEKIKEYLSKKKIAFVDLGNEILDPKDDYQTYAFRVAEAVAKEETRAKKWERRSKGILLCRSSAGVVIAANKVKGIRAAAAVDVKAAKHARQHSDANIIAIAGDWTTHARALNIVSAFLNTDYGKEERHERRIMGIVRYEKQH
ncbi:MAG: RpiB/LacA/LacB family sugar-phosphate isomerase [Nanoarchaeota archaeon]|nr:RpiB/LacA/LacB family sugar-phosphate isomerase [Nanoarchaeota archaeon]